VLNTVVHGLEKVQQDPGDETSPYVPKGTSPRPQSKRYAFVGGVSTLGAYESVRTHSKTKRPTANGLATEITENGNGGKDVTATANGYGLATEITENGNGNGGKDVTATANGNGQRPTANGENTEDGNGNGNGIFTTESTEGTEINGNESFVLRL
jgi:hypothetical protein